MQTKVKKNYEELDLKGILIASIFILLAALALWDTTNMEDLDSFVFPMAVAIAMVAFCILFIVMQIISPSAGQNDEAGTEGGSNVRRVLLAIAMVVSALLMPWVGFIVSAILAFMSIMLLSMYDEWTVKLRFVFPAVGIVIVLGFYLLFAKLLLVPLPIGTIFE